MITKKLIFPFQRKIIVELKCKIKFCINVFCYDNKLTYPVYLSDQKFNDNMDLLLISNEFKSHYVYIKDFDRFRNKNIFVYKNKNKKHFCQCFLQCFSSKEVLIEHRTDCLVINGKQSVKLKSVELVLKIIPNKYLFLLRFMLILNVF